MVPQWREALRDVVYDYIKDNLFPDDSEDDVKAFVKKYAVFHYHHIQDGVARLHRLRSDGHLQSFLHYGVKTLPSGSPSPPTIVRHNFPRAPCSLKDAESFKDQHNPSLTQGTAPSPTSPSSSKLEPAGDSQRVETDASDRKQDPNGSESSKTKNNLKFHFDRDSALKTQTRDSSGIVDDSSDEGADLKTNDVSTSVANDHGASASSSFKQTLGSLMSPIRDRAKTGLGPTNVFHWFWFRSRGFIVSSSFYTSGQSSSAAVAATEPAAE